MDLAPVSSTTSLIAFVDVLAALDPSDLSDVALADEVLGLRRELDRLEGVFARLVAAAHARGVGGVDGAASTAAWLRWRAGMREGEARAAIEAGEACELLVETGRAWRAGEITAGAARVIVGARVAGHDDALVECEPTLLDLARRGNQRLVRRAAAHLRNLCRADGTEPDERAGLHISKTYDGRSVLSAEFRDLDAEIVLTAVHGYTDPPSPDDARTAAQRRADALVRICRVALEHAPSAGFTPVQASVVLDWPTLLDGWLGRCDGEFTGPVHRSDLERLLCDCSVSRVVTGPDGLPIDVGRARRTVPASTRRALVVRDRGCRFPGCDRPPGWCDAHHVIPWSREGPTDLTNLVLLCDHHHELIHRSGWRITFDGFGLRVFRPGGTEVR